jgi:hypothetical protein
MALLAVVIMLHISLDNLNGCYSENISNFYDKINVLMIIGIVFVGTDVFGGLSLWIEGTLCCC